MSSLLIVWNSTNFQEQEGAFNEAVKGVDAIEHTASPFTMAIDDPQGLPFFSFPKMAFLARRINFRIH